MEKKNNSQDRERWRERYAREPQNLFRSNLFIILCLVYLQQKENNIKKQITAHNWSETNKLEMIPDSLLYYKLNTCD